MWEGHKREAVIACLVGITLFVSDFAFGWLTLLTGAIPMIFIIAFIIGLISGGFARGLLCTLASWIAGLVIGFALVPIVMAESITPDTTLLGILVVTIYYPLRGTYDVWFDVTGIAALAVFILSFVITPIIYLISLVFGGAGGAIGGFMRRRMMQTNLAAESSQLGSEG